MVLCYWFRLVHHLMHGLVWILLVDCFRSSSSCNGIIQSCWVGSLYMEFQVWLQALKELRYLCSGWQVIKWVYSSDKISKSGCILVYCLCSLLVVIKFMLPSGDFGICSKVLNEWCLESRGYHIVTIMNIPCHWSCCLVKLSLV